MDMFYLIICKSAAQAGCLVGCLAWSCYLVDGKAGYTPFKIKHLSLILPVYIGFVVFNMLSIYL